MKLQWKMALIVAVFGFIALTLANVLLYTQLRAHDLDEIKNNARQTAKLIRSALLNTMIRTGDYDEIASIINELEKLRDFEFRMVRSEHVVKQHGVKRDETPKDDLEIQVLKTGKIIDVMDTPSILRVIYPFITDERCGACHLGMDGEPVPAGIVNGLAVIRFDLSELQEETKSIILNIMLPMSLIMVLFFVLFLLTVYKTVTRPMKEVASAITGLQDENYEVNLPEYSTTEIQIMAGEVKNTAEKLAERKRIREKETETERKRISKIEDFVRSRGSVFGLEDDIDISDIVGRLTHIMDEAGKSRLISIAYKYLLKEKSHLRLPSDPDLIPAIATYISSLYNANPKAAKTISVELAIDEALSNAMFHGNLEIPSSMKSGDFGKFFKLAHKRKSEEPYASRRVDVEYQLDEKGFQVVIKDEGAGFNWRKGLELSGGQSAASHGRGLSIIRAFSSRVGFNDTGNQVTLYFDFNIDEA